MNTYNIFTLLQIEPTILESTMIFGLRYPCDIRGTEVPAGGALPHRLCMSRYPHESYDRNEHNDFWLEKWGINQWSGFEVDTRYSEVSFVTCILYS